VGRVVVVVEAEEEGHELAGGLVGLARLAVAPLRRAVRLKQVRQQPPVAAPARRVVERLAHEPLRPPRRPRSPRLPLPVLLLLNPRPHDRLGQDLTDLVAPLRACREDGRSLGRRAPQEVIPKPFRGPDEKDESMQHPFAKAAPQSDSTPSLTSIQRPQERCQSCIPVIDGLADLSQSRPIISHDGATRGRRIDSFALRYILELSA
jgi:hypothetical protein